MTQKNNPKWSGLRIFSLIIALNFILFTGTFLLTNTSAVQAQEDIKVTPDPLEEGVRFDNYPHPYSRGALAYSLADSWDKFDLTYYFHNCPSTVSCREGWNAVRAGFESWSEISPLTFTEVTDARDADIELQWSSRGPELGYIGDVLAYATFPSDGGDVFFDDAEPWTLFDGSEFDLYLVATHEIGHALGLNHSSDPEALMYPVLTRRTFGLAQDDAAAIQALYGEPTTRPQQDIPTASDDRFEQVDGEITNNNPIEMWEFDAAAGETLTITMQTTGGNLVPYLGVLTQDEEVLAEAIAQGDSAQVTYTFPADGFYLLAATREGVDEGNTTGSYTLTLEAGGGSTPSGGGSTGGGATPPEGDIRATIQSYTPMQICEVYISPTESDDWGANLLPQTLTNGNYYDFYIAPGLYDVLVVGCDSTELEEYEINVTQDVTIEVYEDDLNPFVYAS